MYARDDRLYSCKARGLFRKEGLTPMVGDYVEITPLHGEEITGNIDRILPRKNSLIRPAISNLDLIFIVFAARTPDPDFNLLDRFLLRMEAEGVSCVLVVNKCDISSEDERRRFKDELLGSPYDIVFTSAKTGEGIDELLSLFKAQKAALAGPSGVGKSSLINAISPSCGIETGRLSEKISRGRHTTRHAELIPLGEDTFIFDTPGFSSAAIPEVEKESLRELYPEYVRLESGCRFRSCIHENEPDCAVKNALSEGIISGGRYNRYLSFLNEIRQRASR